MGRVNSSRKNEILKLLEAGETDLGLIASKVKCSVGYVRRVARELKVHNFGAGETGLDCLPAPLEQDLALVEHLGNAFDGRNDFAAGVKWLGASMMFCCRLLGQLAAVPRMGQVGELTELVTLGKALAPKPAPPDPALLAVLDGIKQGLAGLGKPKTPEMAIFEMLAPIIQGVVGQAMGVMGVPGGAGQSGGSPGAPGLFGEGTPPGFTRRKAAEHEL